MPRKQSTPNSRASANKKYVASVRRKYKVDVSKQSRLLPAEIPLVKNMVVMLHVAHYSKTQIARIIGISRDQVREFLDAEDVQEMIVALRASLPAAAGELLRGYMIEAVQAIVDVMRRSGDDKVVVQAASEILDRGGLAKVSRQEKHQINEEMTTITDDGIVERLREASPEVQEEAAQLIEKLEGLLVSAAEGEEEEATDA